MRTAVCHSLASLNFEGFKKRNRKVGLLVFGLGVILSFGFGMSVILSVKMNEAQNPFAGSPSGAESHFSAPSNKEPSMKGKT